MRTHNSACLVVDDEELICRGILRAFKGRFHRVFTATGPDDAEEILKRCDIAVLVCDYYLGESSPRGTELLEKWRRAYPSIERAILYTGTDPVLIRPSEWVDSTLSKAIPPKELYRVLIAPAEEMGRENQSPTPVVHSLG